jgi:hypothetical protein
VTAQNRLANNLTKGSPGISTFGPGDLHTINLGDFSPSATEVCFGISSFSIILCETRQLGPYSDNSDLRFEAVFL